MRPIGQGERWETFRFDKRIAVSDPGGGTTSDWSTPDNGSLTLRVIVRPDFGEEAVQAQHLTGLQPVKIFARYIEACTIDSSWRAVQLADNGTPVPGGTFALKSAFDMERRRDWWTMKATAGAPDA